MHAKNVTRSFCAILANICRYDSGSSRVVRT
jgi:hypothetical protein